MQSMFDDIDNASLDKLAPSHGHMLLTVKSEVDEAFPLDIALPPTALLPTDEGLSAGLPGNDVAKVKTPPPSLSSRPRRNLLPTLKRECIDLDDEDYSPHKLRRSRTGMKISRLMVACSRAKGTQGLAKLFVCYAIFGSLRGGVRVLRGCDT